MKEKLKVLAADDSIAFRTILKNLLNSLPNCQCIATASNGKIAVRKVKAHTPDLVILDVEMPELDGTAALREIRAFAPDVPVVMLSSFDMSNARKVLSALENGAMDFIAKPVSASGDQSMEELTAKLKPLVNMLEVRKIIRGAKKEPSPANGALPTELTELTAPAEAAEAAAPPAAVKKSVPPRGDDAEAHAGLHRITVLPPHQPGLLLVASSTGGPNALQEILPALPADFPCPVLIVQHMPPMFTKSLAERLNNCCAITVTEAVEGDIPQPGHAYIAPGGRHMMLRKTHKFQHLKYQLHMVDSPPVNSCRPAADVLFKSAARSFEQKILSLILTGMGTDGGDGVQMLNEAGHYCIAQDEASSVVWGMPQEVYNRGLTHEVLPLRDIGPRLTWLAMKRQPGKQEKS